MISVMQLYNVLRKHKDYSRSFSLKNVFMVHIMIRKHEVQSISYIIMTVVVADGTTIRKFEINPIPHSLHFIAIDQYVVAMPEMDPVSGSRFSFSNGACIVVTGDFCVELF